MTQLPAALKSGVPVSVARLVEWQSNSITGNDGQFERSVVAGARVRAGAPVDDLRAAQAAVEMAMRPCGSGQRVIDALAPLVASRRNRPGQDADEQAAIVVYGARFRAYPFAVIRQAAERFIDETPWMPSISEMLPVLEELMRPLHALKAALDAAMARASAPVRPQLEAPRPPATPREALSQLIVLRRQAGDMEGAATREEKLAKLEGRAVESWATEILKARQAKEGAARAELQHVADEARSTAPLPRSLSPGMSARTLRAVAAQHRRQGNLTRAEQLERQAAELEQPKAPT